MTPLYRIHPQDGDQARAEALDRHNAAQAKASALLVFLSRALFVTLAACALLGAALIWRW